MRSISVLKVTLLAAAVALPATFSVAEAKAKPKMTLPPGACAVGKTAITTGQVCSLDCNPQTMWCSQQMCINGTLTAVLPCYGSFCSPKCGG